jgi:hypothetical protein
MKHFRMFESFQEEKSAFIYFINPESLSLTESLDSQDGFFVSESLKTAITTLDAKGYTEGVDYVLVESAADIKFVGLKGDTLEVDVKGQKYGHVAKTGLDIAEIARKFEKMLQFSSWKALNWLNRQTEIVSGSKKKQEDDIDSHLKEGHSEMENYMFFGNLKTMKKCIEMMMELDPVAVDTLLNEHDWASDHIATSKDDVEEVCNWLCNTLGKPLNNTQN